MAPKHASSDASNSDIPKRSWKVLPLTEKVKILNFNWRGGNNPVLAEVAKICIKNFYP